MKLTNIKQTKVLQRLEMYMLNDERLDPLDQVDKKDI